MSGRETVLVTGGNSGIGFECARALAAEGLHVTIASRDVAASERAADRIRAASGDDRVAVLSLDLGSLDAVRAFAREVAARDLPVRALVCNAGLQMNHFATSPEGHELTFAVNHLGHFLLVNLLLERLCANAPARIVVVSSGVHDPSRPTGMPAPDVTDMDSLARTGGSGERAYDGRRAYVNSKLCNLWFSYELARRVQEAGLSTAERPIAVHAYEPGLVPGSGLARDYPPVLRALWNGVGPLFARLAGAFTPMVNLAPASGAALARVVTDPDLASKSGLYFPSHTRWQEGASSPASRDRARAAELWEASVHLAGLTGQESPLAAGD